MAPIEAKQMWRNQYAVECLVPMADRDYLCARAAYRLRLTEQMLWNSLQAIEKYLKAILVLNGRSARKLGHRIDVALDRMLRIDDVPFDIPADVKEFVSYLTAHAPNRYRERPYYTRGRELFQIDKAVWTLRRYCQDIRHPPTSLNKTEAEWITIHMNTIHRPIYRTAPHRFHLFTGYLEDVLKGKHGIESRAALVWNNFFFGSRVRNQVTMSLRSESAVPPHFRHPEVFEYLAEVIDFPKDVHEAMAP